MEDPRKYDTFARSSSAVQAGNFTTLKCTYYSIQNCGICHGTKEFDHGMHNVLHNSRLPLAADAWTNRAECFGPLASPGCILDSKEPFSKTIAAPLGAQLSTIRAGVELLLGTSKKHTCRTLREEEQRCCKCQSMLHVYRTTLRETRVRVRTSHVRSC